MRMMTFDGLNCEVFYFDLKKILEEILRKIVKFQSEIKFDISDFLDGLRNELNLDSFGI